MVSIDEDIPEKAYVSIEGMSTDVQIEDDTPDDPRKRVVLKADASVSLGTMYDSLSELGQQLGSLDEDGKIPLSSDAYLKSLRVVRGGVGVVTTTDVMVAVAAEGAVIDASILTFIFKNKNVF